MVTLTSRIDYTDVTENSGSTSPVQVLITIFFLCRYVLLFKFKIKKPKQTHTELYEKLKYKLWTIYEIIRFRNEMLKFRVPQGVLNLIKKK